MALDIISNFFKNSKAGESLTANMDDGSTSIQSDTTQITVDEETAYKISALYQGLNIICDTIGSMPMYLYQEVEGGYQQILEEDPRNLTLSLMSNEVLSAFNLKRSLLKDLVLHGNAYAEIKREGGGIQLEYIPKQYVTPKKDSAGYYFDVQSFQTDVLGERFEARSIAYSDMLVLIRNNSYNSITGKGLLDIAASTLDLATEETSYMSNMFKNGLSAKAILNAKSGLKQGIKEKLKSDLKDYYSGSSNAGKMIVLEGDFNLMPLTLTPADLRLIENKNFTITDIARFLNIPKHLLNIDRQQGTYSNITQERLQLLQNTLLPYVMLLETAVNQKLLTEEEIKKGMYFKFDTSEMLKLTPEDQANYMISLLKECIVTHEEVRATLGLGGDANTIAELKRMQALKDKVNYSQIEGNDVEKEVKSSEEKPIEESEDKNKEVEEV